jgi:GR25 family glycosyltransferase involved in LPS biosynthesis
MVESFMQCVNFDIIFLEGLAWENAYMHAPLTETSVFSPIRRVRSHHEMRRSYFGGIAAYVLSKTGRQKLLKYMEQKGFYNEQTREECGVPPLPARYLGIDMYMYDFIGSDSSVYAYTIFPHMLFAQDLSSPSDIAETIHEHKSPVLAHYSNGKKISAWSFEASLEIIASINK